EANPEFCNWRMRWRSLPVQFFRFFNKAQRNFLSLGLSPAWAKDRASSLEGSGQPLPDWGEVRHPHVRADIADASTDRLAPSRQPLAQGLRAPIIPNPQESNHVLIDLVDQIRTQISSIPMAWTLPKTRCLSP